MEPNTSPRVFPRHIAILESLDIQGNCLMEQSYIGKCSISARTASFQTCLLPSASLTTARNVPSNYYDDKISRAGRYYEIQQ